MKATFKTVLSVVLCYLMVIFVLPSSVLTAGAADNTLQGEGTSASPYRITSASDFVYAMTTYAGDAGVYFSLENDIDISGQYQSITNFYAHLNGKFHTITADTEFASSNYGSVSNLMYRNQRQYSSGDNNGGFVYNNNSAGTLSGLIVHADVGGSEGAIICRSNYGNIWNCGALGSVDVYSSYGARAGGISYYNSGVIANCYVAAEISATGGGRYGSSTQYPIAANNCRNCVYDSTLYGENIGDGYSTETMKSEEIIALLNKDVMAEDSLWTLDAANINGGYPVLTSAYNAKIVSSKTNILISGTESVTLSCSGGGQIRYTLDGSEPTSSSALYNSPITISNSVTIRARAFKNGLTGMPVRFDYAKVSGAGTSASPYLLNSEAAFLAISELPDDGFFRLTADITFTKDVSTLPEFHGVLDGNNHTIYSVGAGSYQRGLFEKNYGVIKNLRMESGDRNYMTDGAFTYVNYGTVSNCSFNGLVTGYVDSSYTTSPYYMCNGRYGGGGFVSVNLGTITDSVFTGELRMNKGNVVGGFVGTNAGAVINCKFEGNILVNDMNFSYTNYVGGFVGDTTSGSVTDHCTANTESIDATTSSYRGGTVYTFGPLGSNVTECSNTYNYVRFYANYLEWGSCSVSRQNLEGAGYLPNSQVTMGTLGNLTWRFFEGDLTVEGSGAIPDFSYNGLNNTPWYSFRNQIRTINIGADVTAIGNYAFYGTAVKKLVIKSRNLSIRSYSFTDSLLKEIDFGSGSVLLGDHSFSYCEQITSLTIPANVGFATSGDSRGDATFQSCHGIQSLVLNCSAVCQYAFEFCNSMTTVTMNGVKTVNKGAFRKTTSLNTVTVYDNDTVYGEYVFDSSSVQLFRAPNCSTTHAYAPNRFEAIDTSAHTYQVTRWNWGADHTTASVTIGCATHDDFSQTVDATVTIEEQTVTCTTDGTKVYTARAQFGGRTYTTVYNETTPALGHDYIDHEAKAPTCTEIGWNAYQTCSRCDYSTYEEIPALGHNLEEIDRDDPTCEEEGTIYYWCSRCRKYITEDIPAVGHDYASVVTPPTCTEGGYTTYTCSHCHDVYVADEVSALGHDPAEAVIESRIDATCTAAGGYDTVVYCTRCGEELSRVHTVLDALGHDFGEWQTTDEPTCTEDGEKKRTCSRCGHFETCVIDALGHDYDTVVTPATCTERGYTTHTCSRCNDNYIDNEVPALGHDYEVTVMKDATAAKTGRMGVTCSRCDFNQFVIIPVLSEEDYTLSDNTATCTEAGTATYTWKDTTFGVYSVVAASPALGHAEEVVPGTPATYTHTGLTDGVRCSRCGEWIVAQEVIPAKTFLPGDANLDGVVNINDVTVIQLYLADHETFNDEQLASADTNGDGVVNIDDATFLQMYLAEHGVVLGPQATAS